MKKAICILTAGVLVVAVLCACSDDNEIDPVSDTQDIVFDYYGDETIGERAEEMFSTASWSYEQTSTPDGPENFVLSYFVKVVGYAPDLDSNVEMVFQTSYIMQTTGERREWQTEVISTAVDGIDFEADTILEWFYDVLY